MPHLRKRYLQDNVSKAIKLSPIVGILGHRQVGKTTLMESLAHHYYTLDNAKLLANISKDPQKFIDDLNGLKNGIDECQKEPSLFPALKEHVRKDKRPGQFLLSGSVRFTSKKSIQESLTGRILNFELLPFTISEILHLEIPHIMRKALECKSFQNFTTQFHAPAGTIRQITENIESYTQKGGLPSLLFIREEKLRSNKTLDQLQTILDRDVRTVYPTTVSYTQMFEFLTFIAKNQGKPLNFSEVRRQIGLNYSTQKNLLFAFEAVFLIRTMYTHSGKESSNLIYYLEDQGESFTLNPDQTELSLFEQMIYRNFRAEFYYSMGSNFSLFQYQTRGLARIPFVVKTEAGVLGILPILEERPTRSHLASISSFFRSYNNSKVVVVTKTRNTEEIDDRIVVMPAWMVV